MKPDNLHVHLMCGSRKYPYPPPRKTFWTQPPGFRFQGVFDEPPSSQEFQGFLNGDFASHPLEIQSGFGT